jgi:catecholate siderophore receptor
MDAGVFIDLTSNLRGQLNVENLFDADYHASAHNNDNITPGSPRGVRVALTTRF